MSGYIKIKFQAMLSVRISPSEKFLFSTYLCHFNPHSCFIYTFRLHISTYSSGLKQTAQRFSKNITMTSSSLFPCLEVRIYLPKAKGKASTSFLHAYSFLDLPVVSTNEENSCLHQQLTIYCIRAVSFVMLIILCRNLETKKRQPIMIHILSSS